MILIIVFFRYVSYILKVSLLFTVPVLQVTCMVLEEKGVGAEYASKQRKNVGEGRY